VIMEGEARKNPFFDQEELLAEVPNLQPQADDHAIKKMLAPRAPSWEQRTIDPPAAFDGAYVGGPRLFRSPWRRVFG